NKAEGERKKAETQAQLARDARNKAEGERKKADFQRRRAEAHFHETLQMVDLLARVAGEALENKPRVEEAQREVLEQSQGQLTKLLDDRLATLEVRRKLALVYQRMGEIWRKNGRYGLAEAAYRSAIAAFDHLARDDPGEEALYRHHWAVCQNELG